MENARENIIKSHDVAVVKLALIFNRGGICVGNMAVHIPLDVADAVLVNYAGNVIDDIITRLGSCEVKNELVAALAGFSSG